MSRIKFGTDGYRGIIADDFTFEAVRRIAGSICQYLREAGVAARVAVGYDRRFLSLEFARAAAEVFSENGVEVFLSDKPVSTPAVSFFVNHRGLSLGVMITASHNPYCFNGFKLKNQHGASVGPELTSRLEKILSLDAGHVSRQARPDRARLRKADLSLPYLKNLRRFVDLDRIRGSKLSLLMDPMHGSGAGLMEQAFYGTGIKIKSIRDQRDVMFEGSNPEPLEKNLELLKKTMIRGGFDLGVALDGDGDRVAAVTPAGRYLSSHKVICLLLLHFLNNRGLRGRVVKSINTTSMVERICAEYGLPLTEVPIGFKNIAAEILKGDVLIGGEESGGVGFQGYLPERDGVLSGMLLMEMLCWRKIPVTRLLDRMEKQYGKLFYSRWDLHQAGPSHALPRPGRILNRKVKEIKTYDGTKYILDNDSWLLVRCSGTEPVVRIYAESPDEEFTGRLLKYGYRLL